MTDIYHLKGVNFHQNNPHMHDLIRQLADSKILPIVKKILADQLNENDNLQKYPNPPSLPDTYILALSLLQEALSIDSIRWQADWSKIEVDYNRSFPDLPHLSIYNRRCKRLAETTEQLARLWGKSLRPYEDTFMVDSIPISVAHIDREHSISMCRKQLRTAPNKGYSPVKKQYFIGYKLHLVLSLDGVYDSMELTKASAHDSQYLKEITHSGLHNCLVLADKAYLSAQGQQDLFYSKGINLETPMRRNQRNYRRWPKIFKDARCRAETVFSQLCDQMMLKRNYSKTFVGLRTRLIAKVASFTLLQYRNDQNDRPINHIKHALAA